MIDSYWHTGEYEKCFQGCLPLAEQGYPLAECQIGYFYLDGLGVEKNPQRAFFWTERAALHGDWDGQFNLGEFFKKGIAVPANPEKARHWYRLAALQGQKPALEKCRQLGIALEE